MDKLPATHVADHYGDDYFTGGGAGYDDYLASESLVVEAGRRYAKTVSNHVIQPGNCLAIGAAAGFDLLGFREAGWDVLGLEPNATMCRFAKQSHQLEILPTTLESFQISGSQPPFDLVIAIQVIGHFVDVQAAAAKVAELIKPGGLFLVETWNRTSRTAKLFGRHWHEYSPPTVVQWFSPRSLELLMENAGFVKVSSGRPRKYIRSDHAVSLLRYKLDSMPLGRIIKPALSLVPNGKSIPYPAEDLFWTVFRKECV